MKIAFLDYTLENWHAKTFRDLIKKGEYGLELHAVSSENHKDGCRWAEAAGVPYVHDIRDLKGAVDGVMVLAPSDPAAHVRLAEKAVALGVPVYVDKTFAASLADAKTIFGLADKVGVPLFSTSALRCADELKPIRAWGEKLLQAQAWGGGGNFAEYVIHPLEMLISLFGANVTRVEIRRSGELRQITLDYGHRVGTVFSYPQTNGVAYQIMAAKEGTMVQERIASPIFPNLMGEIARFFRSGQEPVCRNETLKIIELIEQFTR